MKCCHHENNDNKQSNCITNVPIFKGLTEEEMHEVALITTAQTLNKGEMVYMAGDKGGKLFVLHSGKVKISRISTGGKEQVIRIVGPGEFIGELSLLSAVPLTDNAEVMEISTMCVIEGEKLKELMTEYTSIAFKVMEELSKRLDRVETMVETINLNTVEQRLAKSLLILAEGKNEITLGMTKGDFASLLGMSQETLSRKLTIFQNEGLIELEGQRNIKIKDKEGLEDIELMGTDWFCNDED